MRLFYNFFYCSLVAALCICHVLAKNNDISIHGSSTFNSLLLASNKKQIEKKANVTLKILVNSSNNGFRDLALGRCDIAMISGPLQSFIDNFNDNSVYAVNIDDYEQFEIGKTTVVFVVNKQNSIDYLSSENLRRICTGDILNWKLVGGNDLRIIFFTTQVGDGVRTIIEDELLKGNFFGVYTTVLQTSEIINSLVSYLPEAIGTNNISLVSDSVKILKTDIELTQSLAFVTKKNPSDEIMAVINALKDLTAKPPKPLN